jgi:cadmium resistance protein CadD (predicted permease)
MWQALGPAVAVFAATNIDDLLLLMLYFGRARGDRALDRRIVLGQYLGFIAIVAVSLLAASGLRLLPGDVIPYFGLVPLLLGARAGVDVWRHRADENAHARDSSAQTPTTGKVAAVTFANGGDNIGVYVPVFSSITAGAITVYVVVFLALVALWCVAGRMVAMHPVTARALSRWGHILLPVVLVGIGTIILVEGGAFGL